MLDLQNNGLLLWLLMGGACLVVLPTLRSLKPRYGGQKHARTSPRQNNNALMLWQAVQVNNIVESLRQRMKTIRGPRESHPSVRC